jgi:predicted aspartyl protease
VITGTVTPEGVPHIHLEVAGQAWPGIIDTGFNGDVELPAQLQDAINAQYLGRITSVLGGGQRVEEDLYLVDFPFDGQVYVLEATFALSAEILIGTHLLRQYRLTIDFPRRTVQLELSHDVSAV